MVDEENKKEDELSQSTTTATTTTAETLEQDRQQELLEHGDHQHPNEPEAESVRVSSVESSNLSSLSTPGSSPTSTLPPSSSTITTTAAVTKETTTTTTTSSSVVSGSDETNEELTSRGENSNRDSTSEILSTSIDTSSPTTTSTTAVSISTTDIIAASTAITTSTSLATKAPVNSAPGPVNVNNQNVRDGGNSKKSEMTTISLKTILSDSSISNVVKLNILCTMLGKQQSSGDLDTGDDDGGGGDEGSSSSKNNSSNYGNNSVINENMTIIDEKNNITDSILHILTSDDMQRLLDGECLRLFFRDHLKLLPVKCVAEILSVLIAVLKKSLLNLESAKEILIDCLRHYCYRCSSSTSTSAAISSNGDHKVSRSSSFSSGTDNLIKHFLREIINLLASYSCDVQKLKYLLASSQEDSRLLHIIRSANSHQKGRPSAFFAFPGTKGSVLALPPLVKWPIQNGWTFISWFRLEPNSINSQPYLYFFRTSKSGVGYSAHFTGNCLVLTSMKIKGKGYQHCIPYEFVPFKWYHCAIAYVAKWRSSEIKVFVNGQLTANTEMSWQVQTQDIFDKCFIGGTADLVSDSHLFCGQLSAIYLLHEALNPSQICAIHRLGPSYMGQYRYPNEMGLFDNMPMMMKKVLYEEKLSSALISLYTPVAVEGDTLCLQSAPKGNVSYFASSPHAALMGNTKAITTRSISDTLQSIGGIKALLPLLNRFTGLHGSNPADSEACSTLIGFICDLLESSPLWFGNEVVQSHGFVIISSLLAKNPRYLINEETLEIILNLTKTLMSAMSTSSLTSSTGDSILLKQLMDSILFNSSLWIYVDSKLQIRLYCYLATEFLTVGAAASSSSSSSSPGSNCDISSTVTRDSGNDSMNSGNYSSINTGVSSTTGGGVSSPGGGVIFSEVRRISTVLQLLHSLKYYYWLVPEDCGPDSHGLHGGNMTTTLGIYSISTQPVQVKARESCYRPSKNDLISIRSYILLFIKQLIIKGNGVHHDELQAILNYLSTVHQDANLIDVLQMLQTLMVEHPSSMIPAFDMKNGVRTVFKLLDSPNEEIRIQSIKLLGYFLSRSTAKRKQDVMGPNNLFMLLRERLIKFTPLSIDTYNALFEILVETPIETIRSNGAGAFGSLRIENPMILKVIATLITDGKKSLQHPVISSSSSSAAAAAVNSNKLSSSSDLHNIAPSKSSSSGFHHGESRCDRNKIKKLFISDLWRLLVNNRENRRLVLQMSVWQHWLINLVEDRNDHVVRDQILAIFRVLLYHAIKYEYGGWRVWIDTLAIIHAKVSFDDFMSQFGGVNSSSNEKRNSNNQASNNVIHNINGIPTSSPSSVSSSTSSTVPLSSSSSKVNNKQPDGADEATPSSKLDKSTKQPADHIINQDKEMTSSSNRKSVHNDVPDSKDHDIKSDNKTGKVNLTNSETLDVADEEDSRPEDEREIHSAEEASRSAKESIEAESEVELTSSEYQTDSQPANDPSNEPDQHVTASSSKTAFSNESIVQEDISSSDDNSEVKKDPKQAQNISEDGKKMVNEDDDKQTLETEKSETLKGENMDDKSKLVDKDDPKGEGEDEVEGNEEKEVREPVISTISSSQTNASLENDDDDDERKKRLPQSDNSNQGTTETDLAPSRAYRKQHPNSLKEFYTNLLQGGRRRSSSTSMPNDKLLSTSASATPAFRIPEFRWSPLHLKLLNDLFYSIECDLQLWKSQSSKDAINSGSGRDVENKSGVILTVSATQLDQILQHPDNQIYIVNSIHLFSQLCDNIIIASGGLLPLLATATGGNHSSSGNNANGGNSAGAGGEGLTLAQANALLYRLVNMADILCFAATHINFAELESEKNMSSGGILRQCLRLVCTVAVKNCLAVQKHHEENGSLDPLNLGKEGYSLGTSINAAAELFGDFGGYHGNESGRGTGHALDTSDIILSDMAPSTNPDLVSGSYLPFHSLPIKDPSKLLQEMDVNRLRACIYRDAEADTKQSQFLALATLYFISVLMVSEYRDIIESKSASTKDRGKRSGNSGAVGGETEESHDEDIGTSGLSEIKSLGNSITIDPASIGNMLTSKLEARLSSICPLLREIMCDFASFLSKTLLGSHGQDLVSKEAVRTFRRPNASPVELVMLLCSQEWQNTLQKNAGLAFIELINEGRLLSHAMKDHIVRVAMEAEFILNRLRADDVSKHEQFSLGCLETLAARAHEEALINSLINSAKRRDRMIFTRFKESLSQQQKRLETDRSKLFYKLDTWEDDARRRRRFLLDPYGEENVSQIEAPINESKSGKEEKDGQTLPTHLIVPKQQQPSTNRTESDDETELFLWESEDMSSSVNGDVDDRPSSAAEFVGTVLYSVECNLIWNIYAIEGTLQITANELFFEAININDSLSVDGACVSKQTNDGSGSGKVKSRPSSGSSRDKLPEENLKGLAGSSSSKPGRGGFRDLDLRVLRYCDLITYNGKIPFNEIRAIFSRRYLLQPVALEIFLAQRTSVMFVFPDSETVKKVVKYLPAVGVGVKYGIPQSRRASLMTPKQLFATSNMTHKWQKREITNFEYLMFLNTIAGRTYQDLNQYPVFPWILTNYDTPELDLSQPTNFRDLSKPIGALNSERRAEFIERYNSWDNSHIPAFHYGTHYSTAAFTLGWLIRLEPFHSAYLALQDGRLENESRLFTSIREAWLGSLMGGHQNVKELIPELFYLPEVLSGTAPRVSQRKLRNVELPKWADSPEHFIRLHRMALESDLVSCQLHQWIDLIFGYKQRGPEAVRAVNVFYYLTYEGNIDLSSVSCNDPALKDAIEAQIRHFGQTPSQLTTEPHPPRSSALHVSPLMFSPVMDEICMSIKFPFNAAITAIAACTINNSSGSSSGSSTSSTTSANPTSLSNIPSSIVTINSAQHYHIHKWNPKECNQPFTLDPALTTPSSTSSSSSSNKRHLLDTTSLCCLSSSSSAPYSPRYIVTIDSKHIIMAPFYDNSFRVYSTETGKLTQVIFGHRGLVTCLARSECNVAVDFYVASGSVDCSVLFWTWNAKYAQIEGNNGASAVSGNPLPKLILTGHESMIMSLLISAELGLISSGSKNMIIVHSITNGDCITVIDVRKRYLNVADAMMMSLNHKSIEPSETSLEENKNVEVKVTLEASMTGEGLVQSSSGRESKSSVSSDKLHRTISVNPSSSHSTGEPSDHNENNTDEAINSCSDDDDYFINNLVLARELAFIVGTACSVDRPTASTLTSTTGSSKMSSSILSSLSSSVTVTTNEPTALLFTFNLRGELHKCINFPRPKDISSLMMTITRDGEYIILSESPYMIKILRTFDVTPLYALNTSDLLTNCPSPELAVRETGQGTNAIKSILLVDYKYLLVGTENGRLIIYKLDFNRWHHEYSSRY